MAGALRDAELSAFSRMRTLNSYTCFMMKSAHVTRHMIWRLFT